MEQLTSTSATLNSKEIEVADESNKTPIGKMTIIAKKRKHSNLLKKFLIMSSFKNVYRSLMEAIENKNKAVITESELSDKLTKKFKAGQFVKCEIF